MKGIIKKTAWVIAVIFLINISPSWALGSTLRIISIKDLKITVKQGAKYSLPQKVAAIFSNKTVKDVAVKWDKNIVNTSKAGNYLFKGSVKGYTRKVTMTVRVTGNEKQVTSPVSISKPSNAPAPSASAAAQTPQAEAAQNTTTAQETVPVSASVPPTAQEILPSPAQQTTPSPVQISAPTSYEEKVYQIGKGEALFKINLKLPNGEVVKEKPIDFFVYMAFIKPNGEEDYGYSRGFNINLWEGLNSHTIYYPLKVPQGVSSFRVSYSADNAPGYVNGWLTEQGSSIYSSDYRVEVKEGETKEITINPIKGVLVRGQMELPPEAKVPEGANIGINFAEDSDRTDGYQRTVSIKPIPNAQKIPFSVTLPEDKDFKIGIQNVFGFTKISYGIIRADKQDMETGIDYEIKVKSPVKLQFSDSGFEKAVRSSFGFENGDIYDYMMGSNGRLELDGAYVQSLSDLSNLPEITDLSISGFENLDNNMEYIYKLKNLTRLTINNCRLSDASFLTKLDKLKVLSITGDRVGNINALSGCKNLNELSLNNCNLSDISFLKQLTGLNTLNIARNNIYDISSLQGLKNMENLNISENSISDISGLKEMKKLKKLNMCLNKIDNIDAISDCKNLTELNISGNRITDIKALSGFKNLRMLNMYRNKISDISPLSECKDMYELSMGRNYIRDISVLRNMTEINSLEMIDNMIRDVSPVSYLKSLRNLQMYDNFFVEDFNPIRSVYNSVDNKDFDLDKYQRASDKANQIIKEIIKPDMKDFEKELAVHDYIVSNVKYDTSTYLGYSSGGMNDSYSAYGALINNSAVCQGYAEAFKLFMDRLGIECYIVYGEGSGLAHAWNIVNIEGNYYQVDSTWDSSNNQGEQHNYFNVTDNLMKMYFHRWEDGIYPICNSLKYSYNNYSYCKRNNIRIEDQGSITGTISLPAGEVAPKGGLNIKISVAPNFGLPATSNFYIADVSFKIPEGKNSVNFNMTVPPSPKGYFISYSIDDKDTGYQPGFLTKQGTAAVYDEYKLVVEEGKISEVVINILK